MMKKVWLGALGLVCISTLHGQTLSPLHQMMATNSLLDRPQIFREMQDKIVDEFGAVTPGLRIDLLYREMSALRKKLWAVIDSPKVDYDSTDNCLTIDFGANIGKGIKICLPATETLVQPQHVRGLAEIFTEVLLKSLLVFKKNETRESILVALLDAMARAGFTPDRELIKNALERKKLIKTEVDLQTLRTFPLAEDNREKLIQMMAALLAQKINHVIGAQIRSLDKEVWRDKIQETLAVALESLALALDKAEHKIAEVLASFSRWLLASNAGLAISEGGEGALAGGVVLSFAAGASTQLGVYVNGQLNRVDPKATAPRQSLLGLQARYARDQWQADLFISRLFGYKKLHAADAMESGAGISCRANKNCIAGAAYFYLFVKNLATVHKFGVTVKGVKPDTPALLLGLAMQKGGPTRPLVQFSLPISMRY